VGECVQTAAYLKDHTLTCTLKDKTPYEIYYGQKPDLSHLRKLGCKAFILIQSSSRPKIYSRSVECVLVGYSPNSKAFRCWNKQTGHITVSRNVHFIESKDTKPHILYSEHTPPNAKPEDDDDESSCMLTHQEEPHTPHIKTEEHCQERVFRPD